MPKRDVANKNKAVRGVVVKKRELLPKDQIDPNTEYGRVSACLGNCNFTVELFYPKTEAQKTLFCHLRGGIRKLFKVKLNDVVVVGLRDFQDTKGDIVYLYNYNEILRLKRAGELPEETDEPYDFEEEESFVPFDFEDI